MDWASSAAPSARFSKEIGERRHARRDRDPRASQSIPGSVGAEAPRSCHGTAHAEPRCLGRADRPSARRSRGAGGARSRRHGGRILRSSRPERRRQNDHDRHSHHACARYRGHGTGRGQERRDARRASPSAHRRGTAAAESRPQSQRRREFALSCGILRHSGRGRADAGDGATRTTRHRRQGVRQSR